MDAPRPGRRRQVVAIAQGVVLRCRGVDRVSSEGRLQSFDGKLGVGTGSAACEACSVNTPSDAVDFAALRDARLGSPGAAEEFPFCLMASGTATGMRVFFTHPSAVAQRRNS